MLYRLPVKITKRDVDAAFGRSPIRPDTCVVLATEFGGIWVDSPNDIIMMRRTLPSVWALARGLLRQMEVLLRNGIVLFPPTDLVATDEVDFIALCWWWWWGRYSLGCRSRSEIITYGGILG